MARELVLVLVTAFAFSGCMLDRAGLGSGSDAGPTDAAPPIDSGRIQVDAGDTDAGPVVARDAGAMDAGLVEPLDAGGRDSGPEPVADAGEDGGPLCISTGPELCDPAGVDEDCDGASNEGCICTLGETQACTPSAGCTGLEACEGATWGVCIADPVTSTCNGLDDDCDGTIDEDSGCFAASGCDVFRAGGRSYLICDFTATSWRAAQTQCEMYGYDLANVGSVAEDDDLIAEANSVGGNDRWYIGYNDEDNDGNFDWVAGGETYVNPSFPAARGACAVIDTQADDWGDDACSEDNPFICEAGL